MTQIALCLGNKNGSYDTKVAGQKHSECAKKYVNIVVKGIALSK